MQHRRTGSHELNMESSRSHSIMTVHCNAVGEDDDSGAGLATMGKISFVDLVRSPSNHPHNLQHGQPRGTFVLCVC